MRRLLGQEGLFDAPAAQPPISDIWVRAVVRKSFRGDYRHGFA